MSERWFGIVENRMDPLRIGRCQVRIYSLHTYDKELQPTESLPWAMVEMPPTLAGVSGIGTMHELVEGSLVRGYFVDEEKQQQPVITGVIASNPVWGDREREKIIAESIFRDLPSMFNDDQEIEFDELPDDVDLVRDLQVRFEFEGPHIYIKPDLEYENRLDVPMQGFGKEDPKRMEVFRHLSAIFSSNINYLCVSNQNRMGKYQFTPNFLISQGFLSGTDILDDESWSGKDGVKSLTDFLQAYNTQEELFVTLAQDVANSFTPNNNADFFGKLMVGVLMFDGLNDWSNTEVVFDDENKSSVDAYMKGLLAHYHAEMV